MPETFRAPRHTHRQGGFTLLELMIVVLVMTILISVGMPSYQRYMLRGYRAEARTALLSAAQWLERAITANGTYPTALPATLQQTDAGRYRITLALSSNNTAFTLTATPQGGQAKDECGNLTLTNTNVRGTSRSNVANCWRR